MACAARRSDRLTRLSGPCAATPRCDRVDMRGVGTDVELTAQSRSLENLLEYIELIISWVIAQKNVILPPPHGFLARELVEYVLREWRSGCASNVCGVGRTASRDTFGVPCRIPCATARCLRYRDDVQIVASTLEVNFRTPIVFDFRVGRNVHFPYRPHSIEVWLRITIHVASRKNERSGNQAEADSSDNNAFQQHIFCFPNVHCRTFSELMHRPSIHP